MAQTNVPAALSLGASQVRVSHDVEQRGCCAFRIARRDQESVLPVMDQLGKRARLYRYHRQAARDGLQRPNALQLDR